MQGDVAIEAHVIFTKERARVLASGRGLRDVLEYSLRRRQPRSRRPYFILAVMFRNRSAKVLSSEMAKPGLVLTRFRKSLRPMVSN